MRTMEAGVALAAGKENVIIQTGECSVTLLPAFGGKIASICVRGRELLQAPLGPVLPRTRTMSFDAGDASGWDECLPSVAACRVETAGELVDVPDHGDMWRVEWERQQTGTAKHGMGSREQGTASSEKVTMRGECFSLPLVMERTVQLTETEKGWALRLSYQVTNVGLVAAPWSWAVHPLFASATGDRIVLPETIDRLRLEGSGGGRLGKNGDEVRWPVARLASGGETDLSAVQPAGAGIGDKLFTGRLRAHENWCALERPSTKVRIHMEFDTSATPYLGLWICSGGWPERPGPKQMCVAMEPATAPVDSLAQTGEWSRSIGPGESCSWPLQVNVETI